MQNRAVVITLAVVVALLCSYYLSFTLVSRGIQKDATEYARKADGEVDFRKRQSYLDSIWREPVYNFLGAEFTYQEVKNNELKLGLDLQGGMQVTLEVSPVEILRAMSGNSRDPQFLQALQRAREMQQNSQDPFVTLFVQAYEEINPQGQLRDIFATSANRERITFESSNDEVAQVLQSEVDDAIDRSFQILRTRIDRFGTTQPNIQRLPGTGRIQVELPGADDVDRIHKNLTSVAKLEFLEVAEGDEFFPSLQNFIAYLSEHEDDPAIVSIVGQRQRPATPATDGNNPFGEGQENEADPFGDSAADATTTTVGPADSASAAAGDTADLANQLATADTMATDSLPQGSLFFDLFQVTQRGDLFVNVRDTAKVNDLLALPQVRSMFPSNIAFAYDVKPFGDTEEFVTLYPVKRTRGGVASLEGDVITDARQDFGENGQPEVTMQMNATGAKKWKKLTGENIGQRVAIALDNQVYSAPVVNGEIPNGSSSISGNFELQEAKDLANILKAGKLPAPTRIVEEAIVGPSLGREAINQGLVSVAAGLGLVVLFMVLYYSTGGIVSDVALLANVFFILGIMAQPQLGTALTLPGIAGIVLTIGMAVDANVLIFERIKEEIARGNSPAAAIKLGYQKALSSIIDGNMTTLLTAIILFLLGTGPIKGFAVTLIIGILCSFFTAVFLTRVIVEWSVKRGRVPSFETSISRKIFNNVHLNVVANRKKAYIFSGSLIVVGLILMFTMGLNFGVDFTGGRSYVVDFNAPVVASDLKATLTDDFENAGTEVKTYNGNSQLKVTTSYLANDESEEADNQVRAALQKGLSEYSDLNPQVVSSSKVGATIADDIKNSALESVFLALAVIFIYVYVRFNRSWQFGLGAVVALFHDVLTVLSAVAIARVLGLQLEVDQVFVAAMLTVVGYSINDTVVIFDRIREYIQDNPRLRVIDLLDEAVSSTLSRTMMTAVTTLFVVLVLFLFGGAVLKGFSFSLIMGVLLGTFSSLFIAPGLIVDTTKSETKTAVKA
ncbi:SecD/SecF fusion protein [Catalinimonas alkaloidigena]|uniref:Multifunctional fusion protein n=1 Tax=Catalinimonas alkaloidigena TaxID=1075417 RepID=A0A1G9DPP7_9BACT|nr:protein translocase subunit SecDF [Catalinimonas alkaloidigena]SDK65832.1 SecD/SecF fusion protein [Catalinimonas alkaloidigena]